MSHSYLVQLGLIMLKSYTNSGKSGLKVKPQKIIYLPDGSNVYGARDTLAVGS